MGPTQLVNTMVQITPARALFVLVTLIAVALAIVAPGLLVLLTTLASLVYLILASIFGKWDIFGDF